VTDEAPPLSIEQERTQTGEPREQGRRDIEEGPKDLAGLRAETISAPPVSASEPNRPDPLERNLIEEGSDGLPSVRGVDPERGEIEDDAAAGFVRHLSEELPVGHLVAARLQVVLDPGKRDRPAEPIDQGTRRPGRKARAGCRLPERKADAGVEIVVASAHRHRALEREVEGHPMGFEGGREVLEVSLKRGLRRERASHRESADDLGAGEARQSPQTGFVQTALEPGAGVHLEDVDALEPRAIEAIRRIPGQPDAQHQAHLSRTSRNAEQSPFPPGTAKKPGILRGRLDSRE
jgi:hypothetical protein